AMAGAGVVVMTPEIEDLANYRVTPECIDVIADSAALLSSRMGHAPVGVVGLSFAGGLALMAASRPGSEKEIGYVLAVGAHDDMARVSRFFATSVIEKPGGDSAPLQPHEYGALLLAYAHLEDFFTPKDLPVAHEALRQWLWEQRDDAMKTSATLSPQGQARFDAILHHRDQLQGILLREILKHQDELDAVSPHDKLKDLHIPVYLLHGAGDNIIPASETLWLARDVPQPELKAVLVSTALTHVDMRKSVPWSEQWALINFMAQVLRATDHLADLGQTAGPSSGSN
ncbi:MAG TPA: alpha/beta hydrolase, partial [Alphaproteobacteria bacterium]|nr:alpha/beta hydrolase [Alphaproteobacteria bacterium]